MSNFGDDQGDDMPYQDSYQKAEANGSSLKLAAERLAAATERPLGSFGQFEESTRTATERLHALAATIAPMTNRPLTPEDRIRWRVEGLPVVLGDGRAWVLHNRAYRHDTPVWDELNASMEECGMFPASLVVRAASALLYANYDVTADEARHLFEPIDLYAVLAPVMSCIDQRDVIPVGNCQIIYDDSAEAPTKE